MDPLYVCVCLCCKSHKYEKLVCRSLTWVVLSIIVHAALRVQDCRQKVQEICEVSAQNARLGPACGKS